MRLTLITVLVPVIAMAFGAAVGWGVVTAYWELSTLNWDKTDMEDLRQTAILAGGACGLVIGLVMVARLWLDRTGGAERRHR